MPLVIPGRHLVEGFLASGQDAQVTEQDGHVILAVDLQPFQLRSFCAPENSAVSGATVSAPGEWIAALNARCAEVRARVASAKQAGLDVARANAALAELDEALREQRYSRAHHLAEGYVFKALARQLEDAKSKKIGR